MILDQIIAHKRHELAQTRQQVPLERLRTTIEAQPPPCDFVQALRAPGVSLIAELKRASPSRGVLRADLDPVALARCYIENGASALSVLTDKRFFQGSLSDLRDIKVQAVQPRSETRNPQPAIPVLRKDFTLDSYHVYEARAHGADAVLLVVAILDDKTLANLLALARALGIAALVEVHNEAELERALLCSPRVIGINNRDLTDFSVDIETTCRLRPLIPAGTIVVSESGIRHRADIERLADAGVDAILVGEALVTADDPAAKVRELSQCTQTQ